MDYMENQLRVRMLRQQWHYYLLRQRSRSQNRSRLSVCVSVCVSVCLCVNTPHNGFVCVSQSIIKNGTLGQKDCTIWETREVHERSSVFIINEFRIEIFSHLLLSSLMVNRVQALNQQNLSHILSIIQGLYTGQVGEGLFSLHFSMTCLFIFTYFSLFFACYHDHHSCGNTCKSTVPPLAGSGWLYLTTLKKTLDQGIFFLLDSTYVQNIYLQRGVKPT